MQVNNDQRINNQTSNFYAYRDTRPLFTSPLFSSPPPSLSVADPGAAASSSSIHTKCSNFKSNVAKHVKDPQHLSKGRKPLENISNRIHPKNSSNLTQSKQKSSWVPLFDESQSVALKTAQTRSKQADESILDIDKNTCHDHLYCTEYINDIIVHLKDLETRNMASPTYMSKQKEINTHLRQILVDWLFETVEELRYVAETMFLLVNYLDRFMSKKSVSKPQLQIIGIASLFVAAKYEEVDAVSLDDLVSLCDYGHVPDQIILMEEILLNTLDFNLNIASVRSFATRFIQVASYLVDDQNLFCPLVYYLSDLSLYEYEMIRYLPSKIAMSAVVLGLHALNVRYWSPTLAFYSSFMFEELTECMVSLHTLWVSSPFLKHNILFKKYSRNEFGRVALIIPPTFPPSAPLS